MSKQKAFPNAIESPKHGTDDGMDLRDYFAAKAMQGELSASENQPKPHALSEFAYQVADAMMEARK